MELLERAELAREVYRALMNRTESFEYRDLGTHVAYLLGSILDSTQFYAICSEHAYFVELLRRAIGTKSNVWTFVSLTNEETHPLPMHDKYMLIEDGDCAVKAFPETSSVHEKNDFQVWKRALNSAALDLS